MTKYPWSRIKKLNCDDKVCGPGLGVRLGVGAFFRWHLWVLPGRSTFFTAVVFLFVVCVCGILSNRRVRKRKCSNKAVLMFLSVVLAADIWLA